MLVAPVVTGSAVLNVGAAVAMVTTTAQLGVERVQSLDVEAGERHRSKQRSDVLTDL
jgi:hypothetical protein